MYFVVVGVYEEWMVVVSLCVVVGEGGLGLGVLVL